MEVGIRPANRRPSLGLRRAVVTALIDRPGYRRNLAEVRYLETGQSVKLPLWRLADAPEDGAN